MTFPRILLTLLLVSLAGTVGAETVSCTDSRGVRHIADSLMRLPAECRDRAQQVRSQDPGKVNYVPSPQKKYRGKSAFERAVQEEDRMHERKRQQASSLLKRATTAADNYQSALYQRKDTLRNKKSGFRKRLLEADRNMQRSREQKEALNAEVAKSRLSTAEKEEIRQQLDRIE